MPKKHSTPLHPIHLTIQNIISQLTLFSAFLQKATGPENTFNTDHNRYPYHINKNIKTT